MAYDTDPEWDIRSSVVSLLAVLAAVGIAVAVGGATDSANLSVFWAVAAAYGVRTIGGVPGAVPIEFSLPRRTAVAAAALGAGTVALELGAQRWERGWETVLVALAAAAAAHVVAVVVLAPPAAWRVRPRFEWHPGDIRPTTLALISGAALAAGAVAMALTEGAAWNAGIGIWTGLFAVTLVVGLWGRGHMRPHP